MFRLLSALSVGALTILTLFTYNAKVVAQDSESIEFQVRHIKQFTKNSGVFQLKSQAGFYNNAALKLKTSAYLIERFKDDSDVISTIKKAAITLDLNANEQTKACAIKLENAADSLNSEVSNYRLRFSGLWVLDLDTSKISFKAGPQCPSILENLPE